MPGAFVAAAARGRPHAIAEAGRGVVVHVVGSGEWLLMADRLMGE